MKPRLLVSIVLAAAFVACSGTPDEAVDAGPTLTPEEQALAQVKTYVDDNLVDLHAAAVALQAAAPDADADGWSATADAQAVEAMKTQWKNARVAYEHVEGAIGVLFPDLDYTTDQRYDAFLADIGSAGDQDLFDDQGVTGIHAIERILWADQIPAKVRQFEEGIPGYEAAAFPVNQQEADAFKNKLCQRLITDIETMQSEFGPLALDPSAAYRGVIGSMREQIEKVELAAGSEEESRYAQYTLADMRVNVQAGVDTYAAFKPWLLSVNGGAALDPEIQAAFARVDDRYAAMTAQFGDAIPPVPADWSSVNPSEAALQTPFGQLWQTLHVESDPDEDGSLVSLLDQSASALGIAQLP